MNGGPIHPDMLPKFADFWLRLFEGSGEGGDPNTCITLFPQHREELVQILRAALALPAQEQALTAEVWVHGSEHAELLSVTGCVSVHVWEDLKTDLTENSPELPEGAYIVPVDRDNTDPTGMASGAYTYYLDWKRAAPDRALEVQG